MVEENDLLTPQERKRIVESIPLISILNVMDLYETNISGSRYRVKSPFLHEGNGGAFEIRKSEKTIENPSPFMGQGEYWRDHKNPDMYGHGAFSFLAYLENADVKNKNDKKRKAEIDRILLKIKDSFLNEEYKFDEEKFNLKRIAHNSNKKISSGGNSKNEDKTFVPPERYDNYLEEGIDYLTSKRGLPKELIKRSLNYDEGKIYTTKTAYGDIKIVFVGAFNSEERSIYGDFKGAGFGSKRDLSGFEVAADENALIFETVVEDGEEYEVIKKGTGYFAITEAAIDALSYNALFPDRFVISSNGCANFNLQYKKTVGYLDSEQEISIRVAFDADEAGDEAAQKLFNAIYVRILIAHKYGDLLKEKYKHLITKEEPNGWKKIIDQWILEKEINLIFESRKDLRAKTSPHLMFFNNPYYQENGYPVYERKEIVEYIEQENNNGEMIVSKRVTFSAPKITDKLEQPTIYFNLSDRVGKILGETKLERSVRVSKANFEKITSSMLVRERPIGEKDWNEVLKKQGIQYITEYSQLYKKGFKDSEGNIIFPKIDDTKSPCSFYRNRNIRDNNDLKKYFNNTKQIIEMEENINDIQKIVEENESDIAILLKNYNKNFKQRREVFQQCNEFFEDKVKPVTPEKREIIEKRFYQPAQNNSKQINNEKIESNSVDKTNNNENKDRVKTLEEINKEGKKKKTNGMFKMMAGSGKGVFNKQENKEKNINQSQTSHKCNENEKEVSLQKYLENNEMDYLGIPSENEDNNDLYFSEHSQQSSFSPFKR